MINNLKKITALALAISSAGAFISSDINVLQMEARADSISGIDSLKVCEEDGSDSVTLYKDSSYETSTKYKSNISKYYAKLDKDVDSFNIDISTENDYDVKIECDDDDYESGDKIDIAKGESLTVKIKVYNDEDDLEGTISIKVERLNKDKDEENDSSQNSTSSSSGSSAASSASTAAKVVDGKTMATGTDISNTSFYDGVSYTYNGAQNETNNNKYRNQWVKKGLEWKYYDANGNVMRNKWLQDGSKWYYLQSNGYMTKGWRFIEKNWYYFDKSGAMVTGWMKDTNEKWYYFYPDGRMAVNTTIDGYKVNARGAYIS